MDWSVHYLNALGELNDLVSRVDEALHAVESRARERIVPIALDIVVQSAPNAIIPEMGFGANAPRPGVIYPSIAPDSSMLAANIGEPFERTIAHELHHALRWRHVGYGETLGEALVSEGLAGRFVQELFGHNGEPWETAIPRKEFPQYAKKACAAAKTTNYDRAKWFFGRGELPRWVGYTLSWEIVCDFLENNPNSKPSMLVSAPAETFKPELIAISREQSILDAPDG